MRAELIVAGYFFLLLVTAGLVSTCGELVAIALWGGRPGWAALVFGVALAAIGGFGWTLTWLR